MRRLVLATAALVLLSVPASRVAAAEPGRPTGPPHPTPRGPAPPAEEPVPGPVNADELRVSVQSDGATSRGLQVHFDRRSRAVDGGKPAAASQFVFLFDRSIRFHPSRFPTCARADLEAAGPAGCPAGSKVGSGTATFYPSGSAEVAVYNTRYGDGQRGVLITVPANGTILENRFERVTGRYRAQFGWGSDELLPSPLPPAERGATTRFQVSFGGTVTDARGTHSFVTSSARPTAPLDFGLWSRFVTGQTLLLTTTGQRPATP